MPYRKEQKQGGEERAEERQACNGRPKPRSAARGLVLTGAGGTRALSAADLAGQGLEVANRSLGIETNLRGKDPNERAAEQPARQARGVVPLDRFKRRNRDLGGSGNLFERESQTLARFA